MWLALFVCLLPYAASRHRGFENSDFPYHPDASNLTSTVDTRSAVTLYSHSMVTVPQHIFVTQRTPTTQIVSFSPDRWPMSKGRLRAYSQLNQSISVTRRASYLRLLQRACQLAPGESPRNCYSKRDWGPNSGDRSYELYRASGYAGVEARERTTFIAGALADSAFAQVLSGARAPEDFVEEARFRFDEQADLACNNHRAVSVRTQSPELYDTYPLFAPVFDELVFNDAEHSEALLGLASGSCRWTPKEEYWIQEVSPLPDQPHPDKIGIAVGEWDHNIEVCAYHGDCSTDSFACINSYRIELLSNTINAATEPVAQLYEFSTQQMPFQGSGDLPTLRATPQLGPYLPCPVAPDGRQQPCMSHSSRPLIPTGVQLRDTAESPSISKGFVEPDPLVLHINNIDIKSLSHMSFDKFALRVQYKVTWADRTAVHPCTIPLYFHGDGVPASGKKVDASKWWWPQPDKDSADKMTYSHRKNLTVCHAPGGAETGADGCVKVTTACTPRSCPWPKQLYLQDKITVEATETASWDLFKYPFDKQIVRLKLRLADDTHYVDKALLERTFLNVTLPEDDSFKDSHDDMYRPDAWSVYSAAVRLDPDDSLGIVFELKVWRNSISTVYKVFIPAVANAFLLMLAPVLAVNARLKVIGLSLVAASAMLNPSFLGLPDDVQGVPFVQSVILIHMVVAFALLAYTMCHAIVDFKYETKVRDEVKRYHKSTVGVRKAKGDEVWKKWLARLGMPYDDASRDELQISVRRDKGDGAVLPKDSSTAEPLDLQRAMVELLLALPCFMHKKDPTRPNTIWMPWNEPQPHILPKYGKHLAARKEWDRVATIVVPLLFLVAWGVDVVIYFAITPSEPK